MPDSLGAQGPPRLQGRHRGGLGPRRAVDATREDGGADGLEIGLTGLRRTHLGEALGGVEQQRCCLVAPASREEHAGP